MQKLDVIIIGAGAAGLMCAAQAGYRGLKVLIIDHAPKAAAKIRISGGGKCNFTNLEVTDKHFICRNPHFVKSALSQYTAQDFINLIERHDLAYEQRELGKLFCKNKASELIQILRTECDWAACNFMLNTKVEKVSLADKVYRLTTSSGQIETDNLVIATGALSFPKLKATDFGYKIAKQFSIPIVPTSAGLVPLNFTDKWLDFCKHLSGIALDVEVAINNSNPKISFAESILFTHKGLSGPAILQISNYWQQGEAIKINLLPNIKVEQELLKVKKENGLLTNWLKQYFPKKFQQSWSEKYPLNDHLADVSHETIKRYAKQLTHWQLYPSAKAGYDKAEVTLGGVDTDYLQSKDGQVKHQQGLYFIGEAIDVTGQLGGYNFQWAWSSGYACGVNIKSK